jgi:hypothetical protein
MKPMILLAMLCVASGAGAQSMNVTAPKRVARKAVDATNAHTSAMTAEQGAPSQAAASPTATPRGAKASAPAPSAANPEGVEPASRTVRGQAAGTTASDTAAAKESFRREVFAYERGGRRDPFESLMTSGELRPLISDVKLVSVVLDPSGRNSVAILRDLNSKEQYRVRVGQTLGRMRVARIAQKSVTFTIEEFGYSRQQELSLGDSNQERTK